VVGVCEDPGALDGILVHAMTRFGQIPNKARPGYLGNNTAEFQLSASCEYTPLNTDLRSHRRQQ
jgi:hypothetical protein